MNTLPTQARAVLLDQYRKDLADAIDGLKQYVNNMTEGKVLLTPHAR